MKNLILIFCSLLIMLCSCKKSSTENSGSALKGNIVVIDENNRPLKDYSGVIITSENSNAENIPIGANGEFNFPRLVNDAAYLVLRFSKTGYGTVTHYYTRAQLDSLRNYSSTVNDVVLLPQSSVTVNSLSGIVDGDKFKMMYNVSLSQINATNGVTIFLSKNNSHVSYDNFTGNNTYARTWTMPVTPGDNLYSFCFKRTIDCDCDFLTSGDTVFIKAYGDAYSPFGNNYFDTRTGQLVFPSLNVNSGTPTISFVVP